MIVTFTANPSLDRTASVGGPLVRGGVHRLSGVTVEPGGKGVNVARVVHLAGRDVVAVLPAAPSDPLLAALTELGVAHRAVPVPTLARTNLTLTEPDGETTKLNEPGAPLSPETTDRLLEALTQAARGAEWVVLSGSLPPGAPADWYATLLAAVRAGGAKVAVDTSDAPLLALADAFPAATPDLLKPNGEELAQLTGADGARLEAGAARGDLGPVVEAAATLVGRGVPAVLATLGGAGAVLVTADGAWHATPPPVVPRSTVGAGDSSVAGYVLADLDGLDAPGRLRRAVAYGSAAAALPGTGLPSPAELDVDGVVVTALAAAGGPQPGAASTAVSDTSTTLTAPPASTREAAVPPTT
ncbi:1-phosphofructokinase family hexose kinase [Agilicoccus flavus]|uniref:1-phosphofructokinase family hexose kinase n=1 Tax=Agilicoccus flavus TaxID=2775968 RepID=UPI001CF64F18|nr:1-phosphofructokinase family hexose kinase [Agilicoccus flavus]